MEQETHDSAPSPSSPPPILLSRYIPSISPNWSERFHSTDADITFRSSDSLLFGIHARYLENTSGVLLSAGLSIDQKDIVDLEENALILELLFQFIYPQLQPALEDMAFSTLAPLAEAVEKYQVYPAMQICNVFMGKALPRHAVEILSYAIKHNYPYLSDRAAPYVTPTNIAQAADTVSSELLRAWAKYYEKWTELMRNATASTLPRGHDNSRCTHWTDYQMSILIGLGSKEGINNDPSIADVIAVPDLAYNYCCRQEAARWQESFLSVCRRMPKFSSFL